ncbi:MAG: 3-methyl-2-oxobutanoate hydroxymethyltransferase [Bdellovibrionales bacterium]|nr:3-methyl-2-oxobutanoate hydroxymethyltransferase [Bdellovibrionales bacterium]
MKSIAPLGRVTVPSLRDRKGDSKKISAITAYDYTFARLVDASGIDLVLVGDSLSSVIQGNSTTLPVTLDEIIYHCKCVARGLQRALLVGDLPFLSYQPSIERAIESSGRLLKEGGVSAVKLEGGIHMAETVRRLVDLDIPVMGHVGLTPQSYHRMGGNKVQGRSSGNGSGSRERVLEDAKAIEDAGAFAVVVEGIPGDLAAEITDALAIPVIGIGAGVECDGQILVLHDVLGLSAEAKPKFVKNYLNLSEIVQTALHNYRKEVELAEFPSHEYSYQSTRKTTRVFTLKKTVKKA